MIICTIIWVQSAFSLGVEASGAGAAPVVDVEGPRDGEMSIADIPAIQSANGCILHQHTVPPHCCEGPVLDPELWKHVKAFSTNWHERELLDSTPRMLERYYTFLHLYDNMQKTHHPHTWGMDCYYGVVSTILNAIPAAEFRDGREKAQNLFHVAKSMLRPPGSNVAEVLSDMARANWSIPLEPLDAQQWPFLLGFTQNNCYGSKLRVYVYDTGKYSRGAVFCSTGQWGVEVLLHQYFRHSTCYTDNPNEADLFFFPDYRACHYHLTPNFQHKGLILTHDEYHSGVIDNHASLTRNASHADDIFKELLQKHLTYFDRKNGIDHIFVFSDQGFIVNFTNTFPSWREYISNSILLTTEAFTPGCGPSCFQPWKDIVIPGHLDKSRLDAIRNFSKPSHDRKLLFNFHGRMGKNHEYYKNNTVRDQLLLSFGLLPDVSVGGFVEDYFEIMGNSHFCLIPEGTSSWTNHLYESFFAGCVPLILSDNFVLPFQDFIPWQQLSIKWPQNFVGMELYQVVKNLVIEKPAIVEAMKQNVEDHACWFDFYSEDPNCSPYQAVTSMLEKRRQQMPMYLHPKDWFPGG